MRIAPVISIVLAGALAWLGCRPEPESPSGARSEAEVAATRLYPDLESLYSGDQGIYRGCGPNNGVCHNSREFPNLATLGSLVENIGLGCNEKREDPKQVHDLCERPGDTFRGARGAKSEIAWVEPDATTPRRYRVKLRDRVDPAGGPWSIVRQDLVIVKLEDFGVTVAADPSDASTLLVTVPKPVVSSTGDDAAEEAQEADVVDPLFAHAGVPGEPRAIRVGDPNRNGTFGAALGGRIIAPGDPEKSYLFKRLADPNAGPLMPRANCCYWTKASLRALWCWVAGLSADGSNALAPIAYDRCPSGPPDTMEYPEPGPACETSGMCPVMPKAKASDAPTFSNVYGGILEQSCAGSGCHIGGAAAGLDMGSKEKAYASLLDGRRVIPGDPKKSVLFIRISPDLCTGGCTTMPRGRPPLDDSTRAVIEHWIADGAKND